MIDIPIKQREINWKIKPPKRIEKGTWFAVVAHFKGMVETVVAEADALDRSGEFLERFSGAERYTYEGFIRNDDRDTTYVWFRIKAPMELVRQKYKVRLSWESGNRPYAGMDEFSVKIQDKCSPPWYCTDDQDLLSHLDSENYAPTPVDQMNENSDRRRPR
ncbi:hypothetical protein O1611_g133 [Lasiodiplodia mahajangana]|uniref:Uncharacterized protein n=1 Tax=Lasiodiplodia mahajangana TaxID=1108764 RepID=A0ACC2K1N7_9PEZI|nr:hypothetical protein O1611_g133 [Lasiodiplodia mahajangana]